MNKNKKVFKFFTAILCISLLTGCNVNTKSNNSDQKSDVSASSEIESTASSAEVEYDQDDYYIDWTNQSPNYVKLSGVDITFEGEGATVKNSTITIDKAGVYVISGKLDNGQIIVDTEDKETVRLVLNGAEINCSDNSPVYFANSKKIVISLADGKENIISDGKSYVLDNSSEEVNSAIYSKSDLTINGTGKLTVNGNFNNGITSKDDLKITGGNIVISSVDDGLMGRDMVAVKDGDIIINAGGKGLKTTNDTNVEKGMICIEGGKLSIKSTDDAIHSINSVTIGGGEISIASDDDGIHADTSIEITGGLINISKSYEGIESSLITISNGDINIVASDDGINVAGGNDSSSINERHGQNNFNLSSDNKLTVNGGNISVNALGDGLDANGSIYIAGGNVAVSGPTSNGNGSLDYDKEFIISGGTLITAGSSGMAQAPSDTSLQNSVMINFKEVQKPGTKINLKDSDGTTILIYEPEKEYQSIVMSSKDLKIDKSYTLFIDDTSIVTFTMSKSIVRISDSGGEITGGMNTMRGPKNGMDKNINPPEGAENMTPPDGENMRKPGESPQKSDSLDGTAYATKEN